MLKSMMPLTCHQRFLKVVLFCVSFLSQTNDYVSPLNLVLPQCGHHEAKVDVRQSGSREHVRCYLVERVCVFQCT